MPPPQTEIRTFRRILFGMCIFWLFELYYRSSNQKDSLKTGAKSKFLLLKISKFFKKIALTQVNNKGPIARQRARSERSNLETRLKFLGARALHAHSMNKFSESSFTCASNTMTNLSQKLRTSKFFYMQILIILYFSIVITFQIQCL